MDFPNPRDNSRLLRELAEETSRVIIRASGNSEGDTDGHSHQRESSCCKYCGKDIHTYAGSLAHRNAHLAEMHGKSSSTEPVEYRVW